MDKTPIPIRSPKPAKLIKRSLKDTPQHQINADVNHDLRMLVTALQAQAHQITILERQLALTQSARPDTRCHCGHVRGAHGDLKGEIGVSLGPCLGKVTVGNPSEPMGNRVYCGCACAGFSIIARPIG